MSDEPVAAHPDTYSDHLCLGRLRTLVALTQDLPANTPVYIERIEDEYFEKHGWQVIRYISDVGPNGDEYIRAWDAGTDHDRKRILIHAHY